MALEIERKFRVVRDDWRVQAHDSRYFAQGYFNDRGHASVRVRIEGDQANLNIKAARIGTTRAEYEYPIPLAEARQMLDELSLTRPVEKTRYWVEHGGRTWEIDEFHGANAPLVIAEVELDDAEAEVTLPDWLGEEVTDDVRYYNHALAFAPYQEWQESS